MYYLTLNSVTTVQARILGYQSSGIGNPDVFLLSGYSSAACVAGGYGDGSIGATATYVNAPPGIVYVVVDGWQGWAQQFLLEVACVGANTPTPTPTHHVRVALPVILNEFYQ